MVPKHAKKRNAGADASPPRRVQLEQEQDKKLASAHEFEAEPEDTRESAQASDTEYINVEQQLEDDETETPSGPRASASPRETGGAPRAPRADALTASSSGLDTVPILHAASGKGPSAQTLGSNTTALAPM